MSLKVENIETYGWEAAVRGMRNPMNSWSMSDSSFVDECHNIGENDLGLMKKLTKAGSDHGKFLRMITVTMDITAPLYWWKEFDTYKVGTVANSCSTMHKIQANEFTLGDFSHEHLTVECRELLEQVIQCLNRERDLYNNGKNKNDWWQMIQLLPTSYNQRRTVQMNYAVALNMYRSRKGHKLDEWHTLCDEIKKLPYFEKICLED